METSRKSTNSNGTFHVAGTVTVPIFQGGKVHADVLQAEAALRQARARLEDLRGANHNIFALPCLTDAAATRRKSPEFRRSGGADSNPRRKIDSLQESPTP